MRDSFKFSAQPVTILLVDDDEDCRQLIRDSIDQGKLDNPVFEVSSGEEALAFLRREGEYANAPRPGLIYLDIEMPGMGGQETLRAIRADPRFADVAVVMMTGVTDDEQKRLAMASGANSYTNKPTDALKFMHTVLESTNYWLRIHQFPSPASTTAHSGAA
jgi:CheY-like chemotaxis protein